MVKYTYRKSKRSMKRMRRGTIGKSRKPARKNKRGGGPRSSRKPPALTGPNVNSRGPGINTGTSRGPSRKRGRGSSSSSGSRKRGRSSSSSRSGSPPIPYSEQPKWMKQAMLVEAWKGFKLKNPKGDPLKLDKWNDGERKLLEETLGKKNDYESGRWKMKLLATNPPIFDYQTDQPKWMQMADSVQEWAAEKKRNAESEYPEYDIAGCVNDHIANDIHTLQKSGVTDDMLAKYAVVLKKRVICDITPGHWGD